MLPEPLRRAIALLARLPGVGEKTAQRHALFLAARPELAGQLAAELAALVERVRPCATCGNLAAVEGDAPPRCTLCSDPRRDAALLCVVARVQDLLAIERSGALRGRYFVLGTLLSPLDGVAPDDLPLAALRARVAEGVREVVIATPPSVDGEATALYLARELEPTGVRVSRIASGIPHGGDLEYADQVTLGRALDGRRRMGGQP